MHNGDTNFAPGIARSTAIDARVPSPTTVLALITAKHRG
jgi:hypothetical protein